jgi:glycosyltransferase involved in cell wall biosynthesis
VVNRGIAQTWHIGMHIALVTETYAPDLNGVARTVAHLVYLLRARGHRVQVVRPRRAGEAARDFDDELAVAGVPLPMYPEVRVASPIRGALRERWSRDLPDVVHAATEGPLGWSAARAAQDLGLPVTTDFRTHFEQYSEHYGLGWCRQLIASYLRRFHNRANMTFVPTSALRSELAAEGFVNLEVVGRGVDTNRFSPRHRNADLRRQWGATDAAPVVLHVGRLAAEKNVELLFDAFRSIATRVPGARMIVVGDGPLRARLEKRHPEVLFTGPLIGASLAAHYASADLFLFPSLTDTFGNVTLEALASGLTVVAFNRGAAQAHIRHGMNGVLVHGDRGIDFIVRACAAAEQHRYLHAMRAQARISALAADWTSVAQRFEQLLTRAIQRCATARIEAAALREETRAVHLPSPVAGEKPDERGRTPVHSARRSDDRFTAERAIARAREVERPTANNPRRKPVADTHPPKLR